MTQKSKSFGVSKVSNLVTGCSVFFLTCAPVHKREAGKSRLETEAVWDGTHTPSAGNT